MSAAKRPRLLSTLAVATSLGLISAIGAVAVRAHGGDPQRIHSCVDNTSGEVLVLADTTGYGNPDARCPRPQQQHALDWNAVGPPGPTGPAGPSGPPGSSPVTATPQIYEYERGLVLVKQGQEKQVVAVPVPGGGIYAVTAKMIVQSRNYLGARCFLSVLGSSSTDDVAYAEAGFQGLHPADTLYLQEIYRLPPRSPLKIFRVRCRNLGIGGVTTPMEITSASIQALRIPHAPK
jgi:hypothetical protein